MKITKKLIAGDMPDIWSCVLLPTKQIEAEVKKYFQKSTVCHDWTHVERVRALVLKIGKKEKADLGILELAALLHDIHKPEEMRCKGKICHAEKGAATARKILKKYGVGESIINKVAHCIISHRRRTNNKPETLEAQVLHDADKLDSIGAVGVARDFLFDGFEASFHNGHKLLYTGNEKKYAKSKVNYDYTVEDSAILEYEKKLKFVKNILLTKEGKRIGRERHEFMEKFFKRFWEEVRAER